MTGHQQDHDRHCAAVEAEIAAYAAVLADADYARPVPTCPGWTVADLTRHLGGVHRWAGGMVRVRTPRRVGLRDLGVTFPPENGGLPDWFAEGGAALAAALRAADPETPMWTWGPDPHASFWARRMVHETAVHRCDAEFALGRAPVVDTAVALDGVAEFLVNLPSAVAFAPKVENLRGEDETLGFAATDVNASWTVRLEPEGFTWREGGGAAEVTVRGSVSDLYLLLWGRLRPGDPRLEVAGDAGLLAHWAENSAM
ncbi:maleylpyruvate isomerase family mycothiol-dependent enzyme [Spirillospora sp. NPDC050679]